MKTVAMDTGGTFTDVVVLDHDTHEIKVLERSFVGDATRIGVTLDSLAGGARGSDGAVIINPDGPDSRRDDGFISNLLLKAADVRRIHAGGGNSVDAPRRRDHGRVVRDLRNRFITAETARDVCGLSAAESARALQLLG
jgi:N-methylhydantoinase B/oxoprolinase/acetone carboxylase alpha subunit